jgi:hypothetical protein
VQLAVDISIIIIAITCVTIGVFACFASYAITKLVRKAEQSLTYVDDVVLETKKRILKIDQIALKVRDSFKSFKNFISMIEWLKELKYDKNK